MRVLLSHLTIALSLVSICTAVCFTVVCTVYNECGATGPSQACLTSYGHCVAIDNGNTVLNKGSSGSGSIYTSNQNGYYLSWHPDDKVIDIKWPDGEVFTAVPMRVTTSGCLKSGEGQCEVQAMFFQNMNSPCSSTSYVKKACSGLAPELDNCSGILSKLGLS